MCPSSTTSASPPATGSKTHAPCCLFRPAREPRRARRRVFKCDQRSHPRTQRRARAARRRQKPHRRRAPSHLRAAREPRRARRWFLEDRQCPHSFQNQYLARAARRRPRPGRRQAPSIPIAHASRGAPVAGSVKTAKAFTSRPFRAQAAPRRPRPGRRRAPFRL